MSLCISCNKQKYSWNDVCTPGEVFLGKHNGICKTPQKDELNHHNE